MANALKGRRRVNLDGQPHHPFSYEDFLKVDLWNLVCFKINNYLAKNNINNTRYCQFVSKYLTILFVCSQVLSEEETKLWCALAQLVLRRLFCWISQVWKVWKLPLWEPSLSSPRWIGSSCEWFPSPQCIQSRLLIQIETGRGEEANYRWTQSQSLRNAIREVHSTYQSTTLVIW